MLTNCAPRFREVYRTKYAKVRIYKVMSVSKESKEWVIENRKCDAPGSWFCPGHYPPALEKILEAFVAPLLVPEIHKTSPQMIGAIFAKVLLHAGVNQPYLHPVYLL